MKIFVDELPAGCGSCPFGAYSRTGGCMGRVPGCADCCLAPLASKREPPDGRRESKIVPLGNGCPEGEPGPQGESGLLACPFCGGTAHTGRYGNLLALDEPQWYVMCEKCKANTGALYGSEDGAATAWNERASA